MRIFVCIKPVPDTAARIKVGKDGKSIDPDGVKYVLGPYDARCVSRAIQLRDQLGDSEVVAVSSGSTKGEKDARKRIKDALALGANRGVFIADEQCENRDPLGVARALAAAIKAEGDFGVVLCGRQAVDDQAVAVGQMLAVQLGVPCVTEAISIEVKGDHAVVRRGAEGRTETLEVKLPCVVTGQRDLGEEMYPKLKEILAAGKKPIKDFAFQFPAPAYEVVAMSPPPEPVAGKIVGEGPDAVPRLFELLQSEAKVISF